MPKPLKFLLAISIAVVYQVQLFCEQVKYYLYTVDLKYYTMGNFFLEFISKLAYAIITSSVFYYITQQFPKENKRIRFSESFNNMFPFIQMPFIDFELDIFKDDLIILNVQDYNKYCETILLDSPVRPQLEKCISWDEFTKQTMEKIISKIDEMNQLNDLLDTNTFVIIQKIKSNCITILNILALRNSERGENNKMTYISYILFSIRTDMILLGDFAGKFVALYSINPGFKSLYDKNERTTTASN